MRASLVWPSVGAVVLAAWVLWSAWRPDAPATQRAATEGAAPPPASAAPPGPMSQDPLPPADPESDAGEGVFDDSAMAWSNVDLDAVREALPDNSYWERSAPTSDPDLLRRREEERAYWDAQYGKVLSNTASEQEVRDYYAHRQQLSTDAIEFSSYLLDQYGDVLPERDVGMLQLALKLHYARLEELPRNLSDSIEGVEAHELRRREWLAQQEQFESGASDAPKGD